MSIERSIVHLPIRLADPYGQVLVFIVSHGNGKQQLGPAG